MTATSDTAPLLTVADFERRVEKLLESAIRPQFWLLFLDEDEVQLPTLVPIDGIPSRPDPEDDVRLAPMFDWLVDQQGAASIAVVLERPGPSRLFDEDVVWVRCLRAAAAHAGVPVRGTLLAHSGGVRWLAPDEWV